MRLAQRGPSSSSCASPPPCTPSFQMQSWTPQPPPSRTGDPASRSFPRVCFLLFSRAFCLFAWVLLFSRFGVFCFALLGWSGVLVSWFGCWWAGVGLVSPAVFLFCRAAFVLLRSRVGFASVWCPACSGVGGLVLPAALLVFPSPGFLARISFDAMSIGNSDSFQGISKIDSRRPRCPALRDLNVKLLRTLRGQGKIARPWTRSLQGGTGDASGDC